MREERLDRNIEGRAHLENLERQLAQGAGGEAVGDGIDRIRDGRGRSAGEAHTQLRRACRLDSDQLSPREACFQSQRDSGDQPAPADRHQDDLGPAFLGDLESDGSLAGDYERMAQLVAQWPPDRLLDTSLTEVRDALRRLASTAIEVFFTERFLRLAKPGGLIAIIVPESIVASDRVGPLRKWLGGQMDLLAVVSLPHKVFTGVGANAKTSIIFTQRLLEPRPTGWNEPADFKDSPVQREHFLGCKQDLFLVKQSQWKSRLPEHNHWGKAQLFEPSWQGARDSKSVVHSCVVST